MGKKSGKHSKKHKKEKKHKHKKKRHSSSSSSSTEDEWVEKEIEVKPSHKREEWMSMELIPTITKSDKRRERESAKKKIDDAEIYNPSTSVRELNPYWKNHGDGLPSTKNKFMKPNDGNDYKPNKANQTKKFGWQKSSAKETAPEINEPSCSNTEITQTDELEESSDYLTDKEMNEIGAKIIKAEILGNATRVQELKEKLERARKFKVDNKIVDDGRKQRTETSRNYVKYMPEDDKRILNNMFEKESRERQNQDKDLLKAAAKLARGDEIDDVFEDNIEKIQSRKRKHEYERVQNFDDCRKCIQNASKHLTITLGELVYLSLPHYSPLTKFQCNITPIRHVRSITNLDEDEWREVLDFRRILTKMFSEVDQDVIFFENANNLSTFPHMVLHCVPVSKEEGSLMPMYFKKAIDECETEWSINKKLVSLSGRDVRKAIPKGLPYFYVAFGMDEGFAHVIEEEKYFPQYFAEEIIGGMLNLHHSTWRKKKSEQFDAQKSRVLSFTELWKKYDFRNK